MKKQFTKVLAVLLCTGFVFSGCGNKEEEAVSETEPQAVEGTEASEEETLQIVGNESADACHVLMTNLTGKNITGLSVKRSDEAEYPANMMKAEQKIENNEEFDFYYMLEDEEATAENNNEEQESELADALVNLTYTLQVTFEDQTVAEFSSFAIEDMEEASLCFEDDVYFLKYTSVSENTEVTTKEMELMVKADNEKADAVVKQIDAIGEVTVESESNIQSARAAYDALSDAQKTKVTNLNKLTDAEQKLAELKQAASEQAAAEAAEAAANNTTADQSSYTDNSYVSSAPETPAVEEAPVVEEAPAEEAPAVPETPEQSTEGCLGDVEINQPAAEEAPAAPEQSTEGCLGDVEINQ